jgi:deoxyhypusine synthase
LVKQARMIILGGGVDKHLITDICLMGNGAGSIRSSIYNTNQELMVVMRAQA